MTSPLKEKQEKQQRCKQLRRLRMDFVNTIKQHWEGKFDFLKAQGQVAIVLVVAYIGNNWPKSYPRNENHNPTMFWVMKVLLWIGALATLKQVPDDPTQRVERTKPVASATGFQIC